MMYEIVRHVHGQTHLLTASVFHCKNFTGHYAVFCVLLIYFNGILSTNLKLENIIASQTKLKTISVRTLATLQVFKSCLLICCCAVVSIKWLPKIGRNKKTSTRRLLVLNLVRLNERLFSSSKIRSSPAI